MTRVVQLTTYPLKHPRHGGQLRSAAIRDAYRALGIEVETIAVAHENFYRASDRESNDIALPADSAYWDPKFPRFADLQTGEFVAGDARFREALFAKLDSLEADVIQLEQPWLYAPVKRYLADRAGVGRAPPRLVYSSHNIEWALKRDEHATAAQSDALESLVRDVQALERELVSRSDMVIACTDDDLVALRVLGGDRGSHAASRIYVAAHNAIAPFENDADRTKTLRRRHGLGCYAIFVGSAHPPNADGFWETLAPSLAFLRPDEKIVVAGGVGHFLRNHRIYSNWSGINEPRLLVLGEVDRDDLSALLYGASAILLPITTGGGSNLKTAEAIYTGRPVLATPRALRGYGDASLWPTITVAATPAEFRACLRTMLDREDAAVAASYSDIRSRVTWAHMLAPLVAAASVFFDVGAPAQRR